MAKTEKPKAKKRKPRPTTPKKKTQKKPPIIGEIFVVKHAEEKKRFLQYFAELPMQKLAAASIGKSEDTIIRWKADDAYFANQIGAAKAFWALQQVSAVRSKEWLLERIMRSDFSATEDPSKQRDVNKELEDALDRVSKILPDSGK